MNKNKGWISGCFWSLVMLIALIFVGNWLSDGEVFELFEDLVFESSEPEYETSRIEEEVTAPVNFEPLVFERQSYFPINNCAHSRLYVGDRAIVAWGDGPNGIRTEPDTHPSDNIIYRAPPGEGLRIIGGPVCNYGWILWQVKTDTGYVGWTPESSGGDFWLTPIESESDMLAQIQNNPRAYEAYEKVSATLKDKNLSESQKRDNIRVYQDTYGKELVATVIRYIPIYQGNGKFQTFDTWSNNLSNSYGSSSGNTPFESDPVGSTLNIFFDSSLENITEQLGLDGW